MRKLLLYIAMPACLLLHSGQQPAGQEGALLLSEAEMLADSAQYDSALAKAHTALRLFQPARGGDALKAGETLLLLGRIFMEQGDYPGAFQQYSQARIIFQKQAAADPLPAAKALNGLGEYYLKTGNTAAAEQHYRQALDIRIRQLGKQHEVVADSYNNLGNCFAAAGQYAAALDMHRRALDIRRERLPADHPDLAVSFNNIGNCLYLSGDFQAALAQFEAALDIRLRVFGPEHLKTAVLYNNTGNCLAALGRPEQALQQYRRATELRRRQLGSRHPSVAAGLENIGDLCFDSGDYITGLDYFRQAYDIQLHAQGAASVAAASLLHKIGLCLQYEGDFDKALRHHTEASAVLLTAFGDLHPFSAGLLNNIGNCYAADKSPAAAEAFYREALRRYEQIHPDGHPDLALVHNNLGAVFLEQENNEAALLAFQQAEAVLLRAGYAADPELARALKNQGVTKARLGRWEEALADFDRATETLRQSDPMTALELGFARGDLLYRRGRALHDETLLRQAAEALHLALERSDSLRFQIAAPAARRRWVAQQFPALSTALQVHFALWEKTGEEIFLEKAFALAERGKSLQLLESLRKEQAERFAGIPQELLEEEQQLGAELNRLEKMRLAFLLQGDAAEAQAAETELTAVRLKLTALIEGFEARYPGYFQLKYARRTESSRSIRDNLLQKRQALVEYFIADSTAYAFIITRETFQGVRMALPATLASEVAALRRAIQAYPSASGEQARKLSEEYARSANLIFKQIVAPVENAGARRCDNWIIVPDGPLAYIPFEALLRNTPEDPGRFKTHPYLLRDYGISYAYSATQLSDLLAQSRQKAPRTMAAFAPAFDNNPYGLAPLQHNRREARAVSALFKGDLLEGHAATADVFLRDAGQYRMLLLATHGKAGAEVGELSYLAFSTPQGQEGGEAFVYVRDLYLQRLPAEMVVLSACETSVGEYQIGEGVVSLAKGFFHAGARSMVATLWSVDDAKNADLMTGFFQNIKKGLRRDRALQQAKLDFLAARPHDESHPVYWAAAVASGDMRPMQFGISLWWGAVVLAALALLAALVYYVRRA